jgi:hypothetical protein
MMMGMVRRVRSEEREESEFLYFILLRSTTGQWVKI